MLGSVDSYDTVCRRLAIKGRCAVLSVDYRLAPETTFPGRLTMPTRPRSGRHETRQSCGSIRRLWRSEATAPRQSGCRSGANEPTIQLISRGVAGAHLSMHGHEPRVPVVFTHASGTC